MTRIIRQASHLVVEKLAKAKCPGTAAPSTVAEKVCILREANPPSHPGGNWEKTDKVMQRDEEGPPKVVIIERRGCISNIITIFIPCNEEFCVDSWTMKRETRWRFTVKLIYKAQAKQSYFWERKDLQKPPLRHSTDHQDLKATASVNSLISKIYLSLHCFSLLVLVNWEESTAGWMSPWTA